MNDILGGAGLVLQFWYVLPIVLIVVLGIFFRTLSGRRLMREYRVTLMIRLLFRRKEYHLVRSLTLSSDRGPRYIGYVLVSRYGLFVLEIKNMKGKISGKEADAEWTQCVQKKSLEFENPLVSNALHRRALIDLVEIDAKKVFPLIICMGRCMFTTPMPPYVTQGRGWIRYLRSFREPVFAEFEVNDIVERIEACRVRAHSKRGRVRARVPGGHGRGERPIRQFFARGLVKSAVVIVPLLLVFLLLVYSSSILFPGSFNGLFFPSAKTQSSHQKQVAIPKKEPTYSFSKKQVQKSIRNLLQQGDHGNALQQETSSVDEEYQYEIKLYSGGVIYTDNAKIVGNTITYVDGNGVTVSIRKDEVQSLKKIDF